MEKQLIKKLKHVHKIIQKKDKNKIEFKNINLKIILSHFFTGFLLSLFSLNAIYDYIHFLNIFNGFFSIIIGTIFISFAYLFKFNLFNVFDFFIDKKFNKYDIFNKYGLYTNFDNFLKKIILNFLEESNEDDIKIHFQTILEIINSIEDSTVQDSIKVKFIEKFKIDIDSIISQNINNNQQNFDIEDNINVEKIIKVNS